MTTLVFPPTLKLPAHMPATGKAVGDLQSTLLKLKLKVKASGVARKKLGASTVNAVKAFQARAGLPADGNMTLDGLVAVGAHAYDSA